MYRGSKSQRAIFAGVLVLLGWSPSGAAESRPNVLFIAVDDLRPELGCCGESHIHSPNIDALAASGRLFVRAYCQQAVCNPSRTSLMTGMRPDSIGVTGNHSHFRDKHPDVVTLPQHFKQHGYHAAAIGKIYHGVFPDGASLTKWDTMGDPESWSVPAIRFGPRYYYTEEGIAAAKSTYEQVYRPKNPSPDDWTKKLVFGPATESPDVPDNILYDGQVADAAITTLQRLKGTKSPFFLAVGFIKPHSPYIAPKKYFDLYADVTLPTHTEFPADTPSFAGHGSGELRRYTDQPKRGVISDANQQRVRHAYYACISFIDAQIGRVLDELDQSGLSKDTIVVLYGDHGYHLGEQGLWGKTTNFELDTRVPLIVRVPGMKAAGKASSSLVELVDLYPTLAELAGLPNSKQLEGKSFAPILDNPDHVTRTMALSQYPRGGGLMGYSMRTDAHRLTHWVHRQSGEIRATELYDYADGLIETKNIAGDSPEVVEELSPQLATAFAGSFVSSPAPREVSQEPVAANGSGGTSFEQVNAGQFDELETPIGTWKPVAGRTIIDDKHANTGKHCLQLAGGEKTAVTLEIADGMDTTGDLTFRAERWTKRAPFSFRIHKNSSHENSSTGWEEIFNGDREVRVGRAFLSHIKVSLGDDTIKQLRFTVTSPPNTGILIDDMRIAPARPQKIVGVEVVPFALPALVENDASPLLKLNIETTGQLNPVSLTQLQGTLDGTDDCSDLESLFIYFSYSDSFSKAQLIGRLGALRAAGKPFVFSSPKGSCQLAEGSNYVWIASQVSKSANIDHRVGAACQQLTFSNGKSVKLAHAPSIQRMGVAVRKGGDDGVNTYRIPGLATTNKGTLIGVYDIRRRTGGDLPGDIDVGMSRSIDGGRTWEPMKVIMDMGDAPEWQYDGIGDPAILVDRNTGTIWVAATWSHGNRSWFGSGPGLQPEETGQLMLVRSDDDGITWSKPINITSQVKRPQWCFILQGPGKGITMRDGTIVFAAQYQDPPEDKRLPHSTIIYSKDHGKTWQVGTGAFDDTTESQVVEVEPGVLMLNCRYNRESVRVVMTTRDMGQTWQKHTTSERALIEPGSCMASLIDVDREAGNDLGKWLLFSNPDSTRGRHHITIKASTDRGLTWPKEHRLLLDEGNGRGYSCMSMIDEKTVGILYEGSQAHMTFQRIPLSDLVDNQTRENRSPARPLPGTAKKSLQLPRVFSSHMVLQADTEIPVWGQAKAGAKVTVALGNESQTVAANAKGEWKVRLPARRADATPSKMSIESAGERIQFIDVLIGEVWVCAGQSNMEWTLSQSASGGEELSNADHPQLRLLHLIGGARGSSGSYTPKHLDRLTPNRFCEGEWNVASMESARDFSAVAWHFGRYLQQELKVPVGLICPAVGGTPTEAWIPREALEADPELKGLVAGNWLDNKRLGEFCRTRGEQNLLAAIQAGEKVLGDNLGPNHSFKPGFMWAAGIEPLIPYAIRGAIWYQGESNAETPSQVREHGRLFPLLINQWRMQWRQGDFPFLFVQLPALNRPEWPWFRDGQRRTLSQLKNVGMAITIDTGHPSNVHPTLKKPVGQRLAKWALGTTYKSMSHATYTGPLFDVAEREGDSVVVSFRHVGNGLQSSDKKPVRYFEVCGKDGVFQPANATIIGKNTIEVSSPSVPEPHDVRYAWLPYPAPSVNLINSVGLPASPFSTESVETLFTRRAASERRNVNDARIIFQQRDIPAGVPREGHAEDATSYGYRIPSLLVTKRGSILAFSERRLGLHDHAQNDIVLKRSTDDGKTWGDEIVAHEDGMNSINDPLTVQLESGRILLMFARFPYGRHARDAGWIKMADLGYNDMKANVLTFICHSDDDGRTWSEPVDISRQVKPPHLLNANTPGAMIQLSQGPHRGRVVTGLWGTLPIMKDGKRSREWQIVVAYSDDGGQTWKRTEPLKDESGKGFPNECQVVEAANGNIVLISRNQGGDRFRKKAISHDGGETWSPLDVDRTLPSVACMGSVIKGPVKEDGKWDLWASFPSNAGRQDGQIVVSENNGKTWRIVKVIYGPFAYSALQISPDQKSLLCFYECDGYKSETLIKIPFTDLLAPAAHVESRPNVLFVSVDDWNDWVGCFGNTQVHTPNVDRLARHGLLFTNAHCVSPVCNPSRAATLTGLRPETTGVYENGHRLRKKRPELVTLPQHFRQQGYYVAGGGKVFHDVPPHCDDPASWDEYFWWNEHGSQGGLFGGAWRSPYSIPPDPDLDDRPIRQITRVTKRNFDWGAVDLSESEWPDSQVASWATEFLSREHARPFFLAVGIFRPHVPWFNPRKYVEKYPLDSIIAPTVKDDDLDDLGPWAKKRAHDPASRHADLVKFGEWKPAVQAYLASISFADANIGRVLDALHKSKYRDNTIVVLWSDHGYHLGEKGHWHKRTLWERSTRIPFIVVAPGTTKAGTKCSRPVSLLDIYPTLVSLCGLNERRELEGHDLTLLLKSPQANWPHPAITTWKPGNHSVRTEQWRYIRYSTGEEELYDHDTDPNEWHNLASKETFDDTKQELARHMPTTASQGAREQ